MKHAQVGTGFLLVSLIVLVIAGAIWFSHPAAAAEPAAKRIAAAAVGDEGALFTAFVSVLRNPRCMNCHSQGDYPRQGDDGHRHAMNVRRGPDGHGVTAEKCSACHQDHNLAGAHLPPGAPNWSLPPAIVILTRKTHREARGREFDPRRDSTPTSPTCLR